MATLPETNISISAVRNILSESTNSLSSLCVSTNINMFSKKKPVRYEKTSTSEWWLGVGNDYSLAIPYFNNTDDQLWTYARPIGGSASPYKLGHFRGYSDQLLLPMLLANAPGSLNKSFTVMGLVAAPGGDVVTLFDMTAYGDLRLGVEVIGSTGSSLGWASESSVGNGVDIDLNGYVNASTITLRFFLTATYKIWGDPNIAHDKYSMPRYSVDDNQFWYNVVVNDTPANPDINSFTTGWNPLTLSLTSTVNTKGYTGNVRVRVIRKSNSVQAAEDIFNVPTANVNIQNIKSNVTLLENTLYVSKLDIYQAGSWNEVYSYEWQTMGSPVGP